MKKNKKTAKLMLKETGLKLREVSIQPKTKKEWIYIAAVKELLQRKKRGDCEKNIASARDEALALAGKAESKEKPLTFNGSCLLNGNKRFK